MNSRGILEELRGAREELLAKAEGVPEPTLRTQPSPDEWSIIEVLAHHIAVDYHYLGEALAIRDDPSHTFIPFDDEKWKAEHVEVRQAPIREIMGALEESHRTVIEALAELTPQDLDRVGKHPRRGPYTVREVFLRFPAHDRNHAVQIESVRERVGL